MRSHVHGVILSLVSASRPAKLRFQPVLIQLRLVVTREGIALQRCSVRTYVVHFTTARSILINYKSLLETSWRHYRSMLPLRTFVFLSRCEGGKLIYRLDFIARALCSSLGSYLVTFAHCCPLLDSLFSRFPRGFPFLARRPFPKRKTEKREKRREEKKRCRPGLTHGLSRIPRLDISHQINRPFSKYVRAPLPRFFSRE